MTPSRGRGEGGGEHHGECVGFLSGRAARAPGADLPRARAVIRLAAPRGSEHVLEVVELARSRKKLVSVLTQSSMCATSGFVLSATRS
ncbi:MAG: hypothetical protein U0166_11335 [Acidobacteriota bacterium]